MKSLFAPIVAILALAAPIGVGAVDDNGEPEVERTAAVTVRVEAGGLRVLDVRPSSAPGAAGVVLSHPGSADDGRRIGLLGADRQPIVTYALSAPEPGIEFVDMPIAADSDELRGGVRRSPVPDVRMFRIPLSNRIAYVHGTSGEPFPVLRLFDTGDDECPPCTGPAELLHPADGTMKDPAEMFDVVILGDGFQDTEQAMLRDRAAFLAKGLMERDPFSRFSEAIQIHLIPGVSADSGIDDCPFADVEKDTCFNTTGFWGGADYPCFCGTPTPEIVEQAIACHLSADADLTIMLVNSTHYGGRGVPNAGQVFVTNYLSKYFIDLVAHEAGHALAGLADEYIGDVPIEPSEDPTLFANVATRAQVEANDTPWTALAPPPFKSLTGEFVHVNEYEGAKSDHCQGDPPIDPQMADAVGAFWGAQYVDHVENAKCTDDRYGDPRGKDYFRPQARCKMRYLSADFCRVCAYELCKKIKERATTDVECEF